MEKELALKLAMTQNPDAPMSTLMEQANLIMDINGANKSAFLKQDIVQVKLVEFLRTCTQREQDLVICQEFLCKCWGLLHIKVQVLKEKLTPAEESDLKCLVPALYRLNLEM